MLTYLFLKLEIQLMYKNYIKRLFDLIISLIFFTLLSPIFVIISLLLLVFLKGNPFFIQPRPGLNEKVFNIIKFKTMLDIFDNNGELLPDENRTFKLGVLIRNLSLDEIPQLLNVIKGDMSIIGPRPLLVSYLDLYNEFQKRRHTVRPGITGWAQVNGRNMLSWEEKFKLDIYYVENISFTFDIKILFKTILKVSKRDDISPKGKFTMEVFKGNK